MASNNPYYVEPPNLNNALQQLMTGYKAVTGIRDENEGRAARQSAQEALMNGGDTRSALARLIGAGQYQGAQVLGSLGKADATDEIKEYNLAKTQGFKGSFFDFKTQLKKAGATNINNSISTGDKSYDTALGKEYSDVFSGTQKAGRNAVSKIGTLDVMDKLVDDPNFSSGPGAEKFQLPLKQAIAKLGGDASAPASMEAFRALSNKAVLESMGGSLGAGVSNADRDFIMGQTATLDTSPAGIKQINSVQRKIAQRELQIAKFAREYATKNNGRLDAGFDEELAKWAAANPMFQKGQGAASTGGGWQEIKPGIRIREKR